uniref:Uncharacterized protein n=1 Tax=Meloidogyne javanica TaxID=6303 RepID=A0A915N068_MELJA
MTEEATFVHPGSIPNLVTNNSKNAEKQPIKIPSEFIPPSQRADAPLAAIIPPELDDIDPRLYLYALFPPWLKLTNHDVIQKSSEGCFELGVG